MQFIPSTWQVVKVDADGDGKRNPQDIDDASLATAVYLCSGTDNLGTRKGQEAAVFRYNHSQSYVNLVLRIMEAYSSGDYTAVPSGTYGGSSFSSSGYSSAIDHSYKVAKQRKQQAAKAKATAIANGTYKPGSGTGSGSGCGSGGTGTGERRLGSGSGAGGLAAAAASERQRRRRSRASSAASTRALGGVTGGGSGSGACAVAVTAPTPTPGSGADAELQAEAQCLPQGHQRRSASPL